MFFTRVTASAGTAAVVVVESELTASAGTTVVAVGSELTASAGTAVVVGGNALAGTTATAAVADEAETEDLDCASRDFSGDLGDFCSFSAAAFFSFHSFGLKFDPVDEDDTGDVGSDDANTAFMSIV